MQAFIALATLLGLISSAAVVAQAVFLSNVIFRVVLRGASASSVLPDLILTGLAVLVRAASSWLAETVAHRTAVTVKSRLRSDMAEAILALGPSGSTGQPAGQLAVTAVKGLDSLDAYFARYIPQLLVATIAPIGLIGWMATLDLLPAVAVSVVVVCIPVFGVLLGLAAKSKAAKQWKELEYFSGHFLDIVQGMTTLRTLGRARVQSQGVEVATDGLRRRSMATLRVAFLSAFALELLAAIGTALVAVIMSLQMMHGSMGLAPALAVLMVAPEVFLPLRQASSQFHASAEGLAALDSAFDLIERSEGLRVPSNRDRPSGRPPAPALEFKHVSVRYTGRTKDALVAPDLGIAAGQHVLLVGPSGSGKSTLLNLVMGFVSPTAGQVLVNGADLGGMDLAAWRRTVAWVPQRPHLFCGSVADNIALGEPSASLDRIVAAAEMSGAMGFISRLPEGMATVLGENGMNLSGGERQRIALARAFLRDPALVVLDEPSASLDRDSEDVVREAVHRLMPGRTVLVSSHRPVWVEDMDCVISLSDGVLSGIERFEVLAS